MGIIWAETQTDEEARALDRRMWDVVGTRQPDGSFVAQASGPAPEDGQFWHDELNRIKDDPDQRYTMARRHLPLPAAWREMAVALRSKIRDARKDKAGYEHLLRDLHHLAAMSSYAGYGYIQRVPFARLASLDLAYHRVGCDNLPLLKPTDCKWMRELWGEPSTHSTAAELYAEMLAADMARIQADEEQEREERTKLLFGDLATESEKPSEAASTNRGGLLGWLFGR